MITRRNMMVSLTAMIAACGPAAPSLSAMAAAAADAPKAKAGTGTYKEPYRPAYHFTPPQGWMNDPNGLVFYEGEYHLFYQFHPHSTVWGPMHWGHAVSKDLVHWANLPVALAPDEKGTIFSGGAVVDTGNTSGFGTKDNPPLVAMFTLYNENYKRAGLAQHQNQGIAYSLDKGRTWTKYKNNPVVKAGIGKPDFRDPTMSWHEPTRSWVMALSAGGHTEFYGSPDLKSWKLLSTFGQKVGAHGGVWECPDLIPMKIAGSEEFRWVLLQSLNPGGPNGGSATQYFVGDFDGKVFTLDPTFSAQLEANGPYWIDWGRDNYAGVTWSDVPAEDGRHLMIGWMNNWDYADKVPTSTWRGAMTLPRELTLHRTPNGFALKSLPVRELTKLEGDEYAVAPQVLKAGLAIDVPGEIVGQSKIDGTFDLPIDGAKLRIEFSNTVGDVYRFSYDSATKAYASDRRNSGEVKFSDKFATAVHTAPRTSANPELKLTLYMDHSSVEIFADEGETALTDTMFPRQPYTKITVFADGQPLRIIELKVTALGSIH